MISLWKDPKGEKVFITKDITGSGRIGDKTKISQLEKEIVSLKQQLNINNPSPSENVRRFIIMHMMIIVSFIHQLQQTQKSEL